MLSRRFVVDELHRLGYSEVADEASRDLPDPVDPEHLEQFAARHNISIDEMINRMGGSP